MSGVTSVDAPGFPISLVRLILAVFLVCSLTYAGPSNGSVSLWSDSACNSHGDTSNFGQQDPIGLMSLLPDTCGVPGATVHSYRVRSNATCSNGTTAGFSYFNTKNCAADPTDENPNPPKLKRQTDSLGLGSNPQLSGECLALVAFNSVAFICDGVNGKSQQIQNPQLTITAQTSSSPTATGSNQPYTGFGSSSNDGNSTASAPSKSATAASSSGSDGGGGGAISPGATAGIGVGTAVGIILLAVLLFFAWKGWKAMRNDVVADSGPVSVAGTVRTRKMRGALNANRVPVESGGDAIHEKGDAAGAHEMATH